MSENFIGLMSGTSLDGIDAVLVSFPRSSGTLQIKAHHFLPYSDDTQQAILALQEISQNEIDKAERLGLTLANLYAKCIKELLSTLPENETKNVIAIACHGQTIRHQPDKQYSVQLGNMAKLAELTNLDVIGHFRVRDLAAGGQGAPLVPAFHQAVFGQASLNRVVLNIGGISNLTRLHPELPIIGFDCGPGNMLMNAWCHKIQGKPYDHEGRWASQGQIYQPLLQRLLSDSFFQEPPPKSTGRDLFSLSWLQQHLDAIPVTLAAIDIQATLLALTAKSIQQAILTHCSNNEQVLVCGGGVYNTALITQLQTLLPQQTISSTATENIDPQQVEAVAFAWLGRQFYHRLPGNLPAATGANGLRVLGALFPR